PCANLFPYTTLFRSRKTATERYIITSYSISTAPRADEYCWQRGADCMNMSYRQNASSSFRIFQTIFSIQHFLKIAKERYGPVLGAMACIIRIPEQEKMVRLRTMRAYPAALAAKGLKAYSQIGMRLFGWPQRAACVGSSQAVAISNGTAPGKGSLAISS